MTKPTALSADQRDTVLRELGRFTSLAAQLLAGLAPAAEAAPQLRAVHDRLRAAGLADPLPSEPCDCGHRIDEHQYGHCNADPDCYCEAGQPPP
ncbi:hypothetical protein ACIA6C_28120 [Streptomyces sp. NPDC051578]|uniref:hypothetical protein n=1 Tax=Streptomyces sp. NPDC051578 TaxID=3365662 RepID=UPI0037A70F0A